MSATAVITAASVNGCMRESVRSVIAAYEAGFDAGYYSEPGPAPFGFGTAEAVAWSEGCMRGSAEAVNDANEQQLSRPAALDGEEEGEL